MEASHFRKDAEQMVWNASAGEIVDEPTELGVLLHPPEKADEAGIVKMVRENRTDHEMNGTIRRECEDVGGDPADAIRGRRQFGCNGDGVGIDVEAGELDSEVALCGPAPDAAQSIAIAAADVEDVERLREGRRDKGVEKLEKRAISKEPAIEAGDVAETGAEFVARAGLIH